MLIEVGPLPEDPALAAAQFHAEVQPRVLAALDSGEPMVTLVFVPAPHAHRAWRLAAVQTLALSRTPARINAIVGDDPAGVAATSAYIAAAPGLTGQVLILDGTGAGPVLG